jgi:hypothetical protein
VDEVAQRVAVVREAGPAELRLCREVGVDPVLEGGPVELVVVEDRQDLVGGAAAAHRDAVGQAEEAVHLGGLLALVRGEAHQQDVRALGAAPRSGEVALDDLDLRGLPVGGPGVGTRHGRERDERGARQDDDLYGDLVTGAGARQGDAGRCGRTAERGVRKERQGEQHADGCGGEGRHAIDGAECEACGGEDEPAQHADAEHGCRVMPIIREALQHLHL